MRTLSADTLYVHSVDDPVVPIADAEAARDAWPRARLMRVDGLGHGRLLIEPAVVEAVVRFVAQADAAPPMDAARRIGAL